MIQTCRRCCMCLNIVSLLVVLKIEDKKEHTSDADVYACKRAVTTCAKVLVEGLLPDWSAASSAIARSHLPLAFQILESMCMDLPSIVLTPESCLGRSYDV